MPQPDTSRLSRALHSIDDWASRAWLAASACVLSVVGLAVTLLKGSNYAVTVFAAIVEVLTLVVVFVVQHTQARNQHITHRKLDELLRAVPGADSMLVMLESASDDEVEEASRRHREHRATG